MSCSPLTSNDSGDFLDDADGVGPSDTRDISHTIIDELSDTVTSESTKLLDEPELRSRVLHQLPDLWRVKVESVLTRGTRNTTLPDMMEEFSRFSENGMSTQRQGEEVPCSTIWRHRCQPSNKAALPNVLRVSLPKSAFSSMIQTAKMAQKRFRFRRSIQFYFCSSAAAAKKRTFCWSRFVLVRVLV